MTQKIKQIIIALVIIVVAFIAFKMFFSSDSSNVALVSEKANSEEFIDGQIILNVLNKLSAITLDDSVFSNKVFTSLVSFERTLEPQIPGRQNPFLPIGVEGSGSQVSRGTSTVRTR